MAHTVCTCVQEPASFITRAHTHTCGIISFSIEHQVRVKILTAGGHLVLLGVVV